MAVKVADTIEPMGQGSFPVVAASNISGLATVATTGDYNDLINTPGGGGGTNSEYAEKIGTDTSHPAIGSTSLPVYVNNAGQLNTITQLAFDDVNITPKSGGMVQQIINLPTTYWTDPATSAAQIGTQAWLYLQTLSAATITDSIFKVYLNNVEYHIGSELTNTNLQSICPNATSVSVSSAYQIYDASNTLLTGFGFVVIPDLGLVTDYIPVADGTIFSGSTYPTAFASFSYMGNGTTPVVESKVQVNTVETKLIQNLANINSNHLTLEADHTNTTQYNILNRITDTISDSEGSCHYGGIANFSYNTPLTIHVEGTTYTGIWYPSNADYPGYGDIHLAYDYFGHLPYCYFTNKIVLLNAGNMCFLLIDGSVYSSIGNADYLEVSSDSIDGKLTIRGQLTVTGNDSTNTSDRGKITANSLYCNGTSITPTETTTTVHTITLFGNSNWTTNKNCWCLQLISAANTNYWGLEQADMTLIGYSAYALLSDFAAGNLTSYCSSADSYTDDLFAHIYIIFQGQTMYFPDCCISKATDGAYYLWLDHQRFDDQQTSSLYLEPGDSFMCAETTIATPGTVNTQRLKIGDTYLTEAQLQALLALITNPPAPATLGIMNIVE